MLFGNVLVTGSNRGIGFHLVKQLLLVPDIDLILATCRSPDSAQALQALAREHSKVQVLPLDVSSVRSIKSAAKTVKEIVGEKGLNLLVNNAGILRYAPTLEQLTAELLMENYATNSVGPFLVTQALMPLLEKAAEFQQGIEMRNTTVVNISSIGGSLTEIPELHGKIISTYGTLIPYFSSKAALNMITRCTAVEKPSIIVVAIHPGVVATNMAGPDADLTGDESASAIVKTLQHLKKEQTGSFLNWEGQVVPW